MQIQITPFQNHTNTNVNDWKSMFGMGYNKSEKNRQKNMKESKVKYNFV